MTFAHKLARRLAVLRAVRPDCTMLPALALTLACSAGVPTGVDSATSFGDAPVVVNPRSLTLETNQSSVFKAYARGVPGDSLVTSIEWTATGGTIGLDGTYMSPSIGSYKVVGKRHGPNRTTSDTATVTVVPSQPSVTTVAVSPSSASVTAGGQQTFSAVGKLSDGSTVAIGVAWTATGGVIDPGGVYTAGATPGTYQVIAKAASANVADTVAVAITAPPQAPSPTPQAPSPTSSSSHPNEPAGMTQFTLRPWDAGNELGWIDVYFGTGANANYYLQTVTDHAGGQSSVGVFRYPAGSSPGWMDGVAPGVASFNPTPSRYLYCDFYMQLSPHYVGHAIENKIVMFNPEIIFLLQGDNTETGSIQYALEVQNSKSGENGFTYSGVQVPRGVWNRIQILADGGASTADGSIQIWANGKLVITRSGLTFSTMPRRWNTMSVNPIWGGNGGSALPETQYLYVDDLYLSGK